MSDPSTPCPSCQGASAEVAVRSLTTHPVKDWFIDDGFFMVGTARCPGCGQLYLETRCFIALAIDDQPSVQKWQPISRQELGSLRNMDNDAILARMDQLAQGRPVLICDDLGARWERDRGDRLMYNFTHVWGMDSVNKAYAMGEQIYVALDTKRLLADGWMHNIYPGTNRGDAIGIVGRDEIAGYAANEAARQTLTATPQSTPFYLVHTLDEEARTETEPDNDIVMGPPPHGVMKALYGLKFRQTLWGIEQVQDGYRITGLIDVSLNVAQMDADKMLHPYSIQSAYLDLIGVVTYREALAYASSDQHQLILASLNPRPTFIAIRVMEM